MKILLDFPSVVKHYAPFFERCFTPANFEHFKKGISGFIVSENKTLTAINEMFVFSPRDQSVFNKFFNSPHTDLKDVNACRLEMLQANKNTCFKSGTKEEGVLSVDSSLLKHYGKEFANIYKLYDYVNNNYRWSHDLVTLYYSDDHTDYPVFHKIWDCPDWEAVADFFRKKKFTVNEDRWKNRHIEPKKWRNYIRDRYKKGRKKHPEVKSVYKTKLHIAEDLIGQFCIEYPEHKFTISLDSGFTSAELSKIITDKLKRDYVGSLREDQKIIRKGGTEQLLSDFIKELKVSHFDKKTKPIFHKTSYHYKGEKNTLYTYVGNHRIAKYDRKQRLVISFLDEELKSSPRLSISNQLNWYAAKILRIRRHRWPVETYHQEGKAEGLEAYQVRNDKPIQTYVTYVIVAYSMLKLTLHDSALQSELQLRLHTKPGDTLPLLRKLFTVEGTIILLEKAYSAWQSGKSAEEFISPILHQLTLT